MNGKDEPVVSIIMPVRDAAATLEDAIDSILHQDYPSIGQIILALGPSEDNTSEIAQLYVAERINESCLLTTLQD